MMKTSDITPIWLYILLALREEQNLPVRTHAHHVHIEGGNKRKKPADGMRKEIKTTFNHRVWEEIDFDRAHVIWLNAGGIKTKNSTEKSTQWIIEEEDEEED